MQGVAMMSLDDYLASRDRLNFGSLWEAINFETDGEATDSTIEAIVNHMINTGLVVEKRNLSEGEIIKALYSYATGRRAYPAWVGKLIRTTTAAWTPVAWGEKEVLFQCSDSTLILVEKGTERGDGSTIFYVPNEVQSMMNPIH
jgi:hypothetical protein